MEIELMEESKKRIDAMSEANEMVIGVDIKVKVLVKKDEFPRDCLVEVMKFVEDLNIIDDYDDYYFTISYMDSDIEDVNKMYLYYVVKIVEILN